MASPKNLIRGGFTNITSAEDYGAMASAPTKNVPEYMHFCTSNKCTHYVKLVTVKHPKTGVVKQMPRNFYHSKVLKFTSNKKSLEPCKDCGSSMVIK